MARRIPSRRGLGGGGGGRSKAIVILCVALAAVRASVAFVPAWRSGLGQTGAAAAAAAAAAASTVRGARPASSLPGQQQPPQHPLILSAAGTSEGSNSGQQRRPKSSGGGEGGGSGGGSSGKKAGGGGGGGGAAAANQRRRRQEAMEGMSVGQKFEMGYDIEPEVVPLEQDDTLPVIETIAAAADKRKAEDIYAIRVSSLTTVSSFFVLVSGNSRPQIQAIAAAIEEDVLEKHAMEPRNGGEGTADSGWILLDFGSVIVNVMTPVARKYYALEKLWKKGEEVDLSHIVRPNAPPLSSMGSLPPQEGVPSTVMDDGMDQENDPFWS